MKMPGMNGDAVCEAIRDDAELANTFVLFLSAMDPTEAKVRSLRAGGDMFISKSVDYEVVVSRIRELFVPHASGPSPRV